MLQNILKIQILKGYLIFSCLIIVTPVAQAWHWKQAWLTPDQIGYQALQNKQPEKAMRYFRNPLWRAVAAYRANDYEQTIASLAKKETALAHYNRGNALAKLDRYEEAIAAYQQALQLDPHDNDLLFNKALVEKLLKSTQPRTDPHQINPKTQTGSKNKPQQQAASSTASKQPEQQKNKITQSTSNQSVSNLANQKQSKHQQWLETIDDDPGGLLKQKFLRDLQQ